MRRAIHAFAAVRDQWRDDMLRILTEGGGQQAIATKATQPIEGATIEC